MKKVFIKDKTRKKHEFQFFMHQFIESGKKNDFVPLKEFNDNLLFRTIRKLSNKMSFTLNSKQEEKSIIVASGGMDLYNSSFPYLNYEIIPMLWDVWPHYWPTLFRDLRRLHCKLVFVTVRQMATKIQNELGIKAYWIPEGIDINDYHEGRALQERSIEIYEMGRQYSKYHKVIQNLLDKGIISSYKGNTYYDKEMTQTKSLAFETAEDLLKALPDIKIIICFPQTDTHPDRAGDLETLTQRYWEGMLSRCLLIGRAPQELIDMVGYNPVVDIDWNNPEKQLQEILGNIEKYQSLVNRNYEVARENASWDNRWILIKEILKENGYKNDFL